MENYQQYSEQPEQVNVPSPVMDSVMPTLIESSILATIVYYLITSIIKPILIDDRNRWFEVIEKLTESIDKLADKFEFLKDRIDHLEARLDDRYRD